MSSAPVPTPPRPSPGSGGPPRALEAGARLAGYRLITPIGSGGMGRVFLAHDDALDRKVALKVLPPEDADDEARARFLRESRALARVDHPHVVRVFASGDDDGIAWMALEYIEGDPLTLLLGEGPLDEETALSLAAQAARGLAAAHAEGVVHRDVKPDNLLLDDEGVLRVVDFGIALVTEPQGTGGFQTLSGVAVGTPHYMAPEQARGGAVDERADAWGLGATLYTLLCGRPPFYVDDDEGDLEILARVLKDPVPDVRDHVPAVSEGTARLVSRLLEKDREARLCDLAAVADALDALADAAMQPTHAPSPSPSQPHREPSSSPREPPPSPAEVSPAEAKGFQLALLLVAGLLLLAAGGVVGKIASDRRSVAKTPEPEAPPSVLEERPRAEGAQPLALALPRPVDVIPEEAPPAPADPEAEAQRLLEAALRGGPDAEAALALLVAREDALATRTLVDLVKAEGAVGDRVLDLVGQARATRHFAAVETALFGRNAGRQRRAVALLVEVRNVEALQLLTRASQEHPDPKVRELALMGRRELFSVEGE